MRRKIVGYVAACAAAGFVLSLVIGWYLLLPARPTGNPVVVGLRLFATMVYTWAVASLGVVVIGLPALLLAFVTEARGWRRWWVYALLGALPGLLAGWLLLDDLNASLAGAGLFAALGLIAGSIYWRVAVHGRSLEQANLEASRPTSWIE